MRSKTMVYGVNPVRESLVSGAGVDKIYLLQNRRDQAVDEVRTLAKRHKVRLFATTREQLDRMAQTPKHQGMVAFLSSEAYDDLDELILKAKAGPEPPFLFLIDGVEDPRNLGAIIRTADAAGAHGVVIPARRAVGLTATVSKSSAGASAHLPVAQVNNLGRGIEQLKKEGLWVVGLDISGKTPYTGYDFTGPVAIVAGGEGKGIRQKVLEKCDETISLPMLGHVQSLNVSVAVGIVAYEAVRQRALT
ncbi:MAG: 23S rRNA (guanosine(2251)-2'-O)-methyltransferase RlmB [Nitrospiria bacterium]